MTEAVEFQHKSSTVKPQPGYTFNFHRLWHSQNKEPLQEKKKTHIASKIKARGTETVVKNAKAGCPVQGKKATSETTTAWRERIMHLEKAAECRAGLTLWSQIQG